MKHDEQVMLYSREWLEHERRKARQKALTVLVRKIAELENEKDGE